MKKTQKHSDTAGDMLRDIVLLAMMKNLVAIATPAQVKRSRCWDEEIDGVRVFRFDLAGVRLEVRAQVRSDLLADEWIALEVHPAGGIDGRGGGGSVQLHDDLVARLLALFDAHPWFECLGVGGIEDGTILSVAWTPAGAEIAGKVLQVVPYSPDRRAGTKGARRGAR